MSELYKLLSKRTSKVAVRSAAQLQYEKTFSQYQGRILEMVDPSYEVGIEIEVERVKPNHITLYTVWEAKPDGSLRDNGIEYVSAPINGAHLHFALNQFFGELPKGYRFSPRTSIHIHLNVLDLTLEQIVGLQLTYSAVEKLLYKFVGHDRDKSNFCVPYYECGFHRYLGNMLDPEEGLSSLIRWEQWRYLGLNIASLVKFGTLEFRHLVGTDDKVLICQWINLLFCLKKFALTHDMQTIKARIEKLNSTSAYDLFVRDVFGPCANYLDCSNLQRDMERAVSLVKKTVLSKNPLEARLDKIRHTKCHWYLALTEKKPEKVNMAMEFVRQAPPPRRREARAPALGRGEREFRAMRDEALAGLRINVAPPPAQVEQQVGFQPMNFNIPADFIQYLDEEDD